MNLKQDDDLNQQAQKLTDFCGLVQFGMKDEHPSIAALLGAVKRGAQTFSRNVPKHKGSTQEDIWTSFPKAMEYQYTPVFPTQPPTEEKTV
jgi:hypothetical protein